MALLDETETLSAIRPADGTEVCLFVAIDPETMHELEQRVAARGTALDVVASDALRAGAHAA